MVPSTVVIYDRLDEYTKLVKHLGGQEFKLSDSIKHLDFTGKFTSISDKLDSDSNQTVLNFHLLELVSSSSSIRRS